MLNCIYECTHTHIETSDRKLSGTKTKLHQKQRRLQNFEQKKKGIFFFKKRKKKLN